MIFCGISMNVLAASSYIWKEEVQLHDGRKIIAERSVESGGRHEIGQKQPMKEQSLSFRFPGTNEEVLWQDNFTADVGGANFLPMQLEIVKDVAYLVAYPMGSSSFIKWGSPNPPYVIFQYQNKQWSRISLDDFPDELKIPNLIFSSPDEEARKFGTAMVTSEKIRELYDQYKQPEFKTILRTPIYYGAPRPEHKGPQAPHPMKSKKTE